MFHTGSGKTSLLDVIACRNKSGKVTGDVMLNGVTRTQDMLTKRAAYVRQDDRLMASLTVRETLMFVAQLKLPKSFGDDEIKARVSDWEWDLRDSLTGNPLNLFKLRKTIHTES